MPEDDSFDVLGLGKGLATGPRGLFEKGLRVRLSKIMELSREGLSPASQIVGGLRGDKGRPRFAGVRLSAPDAAAAWGISRQVAGGEYKVAGLLPERGDRIVDIGANIGVYSLWASRRGASVVAYEPGPATHGHLERNVRGRNVTPVPAAVVGRVPDDGQVALYLHDERSTRNTLLGREIESGEALGRQVKVPAVSLADVLATECDLLKVDCEGAEFEMFAYCSPAALRGARRVVMEFHRLAGDPKDLLGILRAAGFRAEFVQGTGQDLLGVIGAWRLES